MDRTSVDWKGYIPAATVPFDARGEFSLSSWTRLLEWLLENRMHGIIVAGTTGEWFSMSDAELARQVKRAGEILSGKITLIAGCNSYTAKKAIEKAAVAADAGFDGILLTPPPYVRPTEREIAQFYADVNDETPLPICIYNWPPGTNVDMSLKLLEELAELDKVVALKNSTPDEAHFLETLHALHDRLRIFGIPTTDEGIELVRSGKADGLMGAGAVLGSEHPDFFNAIWDGDVERARLLGARDRVIMESWFTPEYTGRFGSAQATLKAGLNLQGLPGGHVRRPLLDLDPQGVENVRATLIELGMIAGDRAAR